MTLPKGKSRKRKSEDTHQMKTMSSRRRKKSRSLKDRGSQTQVRHIRQAQNTKHTLNRRQPIVVKLMTQNKR